MLTLSGNDCDSCEDTNTEEEHQSEIKARLLRYACFFVRVPFVCFLQTGARVLFDPVFGDRSLPSQFLGAKMYTESPWTIENIQEANAVIVSVSSLLSD